ncbi:MULTISPECIES: hypothetical protein [Giesbergeria]|uniref:Uncharacterized protein n=1 Tax=Giesbergeria sinuosa TaxID=80883 RepID=A0ABV9QG05_9BURK
MKALFASALLALTPALVLAVPSASKSGTSVKKTAAVKAKPSQKVVVAKADTRSNRGRAVAVGAAAVGAGALGAAALASTPVAAASLSPEALSVAERVHTGTIACELGASVRVTADPQAPGHFHVDGKGFKYHMAPVATTTGTVRLEDQKAGAVWLQIANKSMLMDQKRGQRLADECMSPEQYQVAQAIKKNPPPSVLDAQPTATR